MSEASIQLLKQHVNDRISKLEAIFKMLAPVVDPKAGGKAQRNRTTLKKWKNSPRRNGGPSSSRSRPKS
jgi:hypothetical protein